MCIRDRDQAERWQKETEREFSLWASNKRACDATGMNNFYGLQQLALISWLLSGDCIGLIKQYETTQLLPYSLRVHLIESDRIATPNNYGAGTTLYYTTGKNPETGNTIYAVSYTHLRNGKARRADRLRNALLRRCELVDGMRRPSW